MSFPRPSSFQRRESGALSGADERRYRDPHLFGGVSQGQAARDQLQTAHGRFTLVDAHCASPTKPVPVRNGS